jgi:Ca-activated chloride channel family protein
MVFGKYRGPVKGKVVITGKSSHGNYAREIEIPSGIEAHNPGLRYLWARQRVRMLSDMNQLALSDPLVQEVTQLGLEYNLLTEYTSFVAVDSLQRAAATNHATIHQPLPLPQGVSDYALGARSQSFTKSVGVAKQQMWLANAQDATQVQAAPEVLHRSEKEEAAQGMTVMQPTMVEVKMKVRILAGYLNQTGAEQTLAGFGADWTQLIKAAAKTGTVTLNLRINKQGKVAQVQVVRDTLRLRNLISKIKADCQRILFAAGKDGDVIQLEIQSR